MDLFAELVALMPPPQSPIGSTGDWGRVEKHLGTSLPNDYKEFVRIYGAGSIGDLSIHVSSPFSQVTSLQAYVDGTAEAYRRMLKMGWVLPSPIFPEDGGLLGWGNTDNGDYLNWETKGKSDAWTVVLWHSGDAEFYRFDMSMARFLLEVVSYRLKVFPSDCFPQPVKYVPSAGTVLA